MNKVQSKRLHNDSAKTTINQYESSDAQTLSPNSTLTRLEQRYQTLDVLGQGGMGLVLRAKDRGLLRNVALKRMRKELSEHPGLAHHLVDEARVGANLQHPGVPQVYDLGIDADGQPFYAMQVIEGTAWSACIGDDLVRDIEILESVAQTMAFAHHRGVVHRDIKPENIFLGAFGEVYVGDWGIAIGVTAEAVAPRQHLGQAIGTLLYMAPEMARGEQVSAAADIYLLGAVLWELLAGFAPHDYPDPDLDTHAMLRQISRNAVWEPDWNDIALWREERNACEALIAIARRAMAAEPTERFQNAQAFRDSLRAWRDNRHSMAISQRAVALLHDNSDNLSYQICAQATTLVDEALALWPANPVARDLPWTITKTQADLALRHNDLGLVASLLDDPNLTAEADPEELRQLQDHRTACEQEEANRRALEQSTRKRWVTSFMYQAGTHGLDHVERSFLVHGTIEDHPEGILLSNGHPAILACQLPFNDSVTLVFEAQQLDPQDDLSCFIGAPRDLQLNRMPKRGLEFKFGWDGCRLNTVFHKRKPLFEAPAMRGQNHGWHRIWVRREGDQLCWRVDDQTLFEGRYTPATDDGPLVGIWSYHTPTIIRHIQISMHAFGEHVSLFDLSRRHLYQGELDTARHLCEDIAQLEASEANLKKLDILRREIETRELADRQWATVLAALQRHPEVSRQAVHRVGHDCSMKVPDGVDAAPYLAAAVSGGIPELSIGTDGSFSSPTSTPSTPPCDLTPLRSGRLTSLLCHRPVRHVEILKGLPLEHLRLHHVPGGVDWEDLLATAALKSLFLHSSDVRQVDWIPRPSLKELDLRDNRITDCSALMPLALQHLNLSGNPIGRLSDLNLAELRNLYVSDCGLSDLPDLRGSRVARIQAGHNLIRDMDAFTGMHLTRLVLHHNRIERAADVVSYLLDLSHNPLRRADGLRGSVLTNLVLNHCPIDDTGFLTETRVVHLHMEHCGLARFQAGEMSESLHLAHNAITDLSDLLRTGAAVIDICHNPLRSLEGLIDHPDGTDWFCWCPTLSAAHYRQVADALTENALLADRLRIYAAMRDQDRKALQRCACESPTTRSPRLLTLPVPCRSLAEAERIAAPLGGIYQSDQHLEPSWISQPRCGRPAIKDCHGRLRILSDMRRPSRQLSMIFPVVSLD